MLRLKAISTLEFPNTNEDVGSLISGIFSSSIFKPLLLVVVVLSIMFNPAHIVEDGAALKVGLDWQVMIKLMLSSMAGLLGVWGLIQSSDARRAVTSLPSVAILIILFLALPASLTGNSMSSLPATLINIGYVGLIAVVATALGWQQTVLAILIGVSLASAASWLMYFVVPSYGIYPEYLGSITVERLGGMSHPNMVGRSAGIGLLISFSFWRSRKINVLVFGVFLFFFGMTLIYSVSRTAMIASFVGLIVMHLQQFKTQAGLRFIAFGLFCLLFGVFALGMTGKEATVFEKFGSSISKTGDSRELTTGTGRSEIWEESIRLIKESPATGYGFGAAQDILENFSQSTHNIVLNAALVSGVLGGVIMMGLYLWLFLISVNSRIPVIATLAVFLMVSGLVEDTVLETFPAAGTMIFIFCCIHPLSESSGTTGDELTGSTLPEPS